MISLPQNLSNILCIYHDDPDGCAAASVIAYKYGLDKCTFHPTHHHQPPPRTTGKSVFIVDFSYDEDILDMIHQDASFLCVIDHHVSRKEMLLTKEYTIFDNDYSGCVLTWKTLFPHKSTPRFLQLIEDMDLWTWNLVGSKAFIAGLSLVDLTPQSYLDFFLVDNPDLLIQDYQQEGITILKYQERQIQYYLDTYVSYIEFEGYTVPICNCSDTCILHQLGNRLSVNNPFALIYHDDHKKNIRKFSLVSQENSVDVSIIARKYNGGGHVCASGFSQILSESFL